MESNLKEVSTGQACELQQAFKIDPGKVQAHLDTMVRQSVEQTLNQLLDAEADALCQARKYERSPQRTDARRDTRAGSYPRNCRPRPVK
jgi:transposase-like protein